MPVRGIRGATTVAANNKKEIIKATKELLLAIVKKNKIKIPDIASIIFSATRDLDAEFPAVAAREMGWKNTPLMCCYEIDVPGGLRQCVRILMHVNTGKKQSAIKSVYLKEAQKLRN